jgi:glycosyltransferase involved in cell wall biosynthesis
MIKKRILIDASTVTNQVDGLSHYIINLIKHLPEEVYVDFDVKILVNRNVDRKELDDLFVNDKLTKIQYKISPVGPRRDIDFIFFFMKYRDSFDIFHCTCNWYPFFFKGGIATVHDITYKKFFDADRFKLFFVKKYMDLAIKNLVKNSAVVVSISNSTKAELVHYFNLTNVEQAKINVVYEGWEHIKREENLSIIDAGIEITNYFLYVGSSRVHKNILKLLQAYQIASTSVPNIERLLITGDMEFLSPTIKALVVEINKNGERVIFTGYVSSSKLHSIYSNALAIVFPSLSEGFGIPVLEAFYYNKPLLCSNTTSIPEVAGSAAIYFDPYSERDIAEKLIFFYNNKRLVTHLVQEGRNQLEKFSWYKCGREMEKIYRTFL